MCKCFLKVLYVKEQRGLPNFNLSCLHCENKIWNVCITACQKDIFVIISVCFSSFMHLTCSFNVILPLHVLRFIYTVLYNYWLNCILYIHIPMLYDIINTIKVNKIWCTHIVAIRSI